MTSVYFDFGLIQVEVEIDPQIATFVSLFLRVRAQVKKTFVSVFFKKKYQAVKHDKRQCLLSRHRIFFIVASLQKIQDRATLRIR